MKKCGDCIHADICKQVNGRWFSPENIAYCNGFKDRTKYMEVVHGEWIQCDDDFVMWYECSVCGGTSPGASHYCPRCGARMDLEE